MKSLIIYFSMSGYTRKVAEHICEGISEKAGQCDLKSLGEVDTTVLGDYDLVGLGCPVYYYKEPFNVTDFINGLPELRNKQWFVFCTHGMVLGNTLVSMFEKLKEKGIQVVGYFDTYADATAPFFAYPVPTSGHPDSEEYEEACSFGRDVVERSRRIAEGEAGLIPSPDPVAKEWIERADMMSREALGQLMPRLRIDMEKCTHCHACEEACPANGIDVGVDPPRIQNPCIYCYQCPMICPTLAIDADWDVVKSWFNDELFALYLAELAKAEAKGKFRWRVDLTSVDFQDAQFEQRRRKVEEDS